jgi:hypothetical protein
MLQLEHFCNQHEKVNAQIKQVQHTTINTLNIPQYRRHCARQNKCDELKTGVG